MPSVAVLYGVFGRSTKCLRRLQKQSFGSEQPYFIEFHFDFIAKHRAAKYNREMLRLRPVTRKKVIRRITQIKKLTNGGNASYALSFGLEATFTKKHYEKLLPLFREHWPHSLVVSNYPRVFVRGADFIELHGYEKRPNFSGNCILNGDGTSIHEHGSRYRGQSFTVRDVRRWVSHGRQASCILLLWRARWQDSTEQFSIGYRQRTFRFTLKDINLITNILRS